MFQTPRNKWMFTQYYFIAFYCIAGFVLESNVYGLFARFIFICCGCAEPQFFTINFDFKCENENKMISRTHHLLRRTIWVILIGIINNETNPLISMAEEKRWKTPPCTHNTSAYALKTILKTPSLRECNVCGFGCPCVETRLRCRQIAGPRLTRRGWRGTTESIREPEWRCFVWFSWYDIGIGLCRVRFHLNRFVSPYSGRVARSCCYKIAYFWLNIPTNKIFILTFP